MLLLYRFTRLLKPGRLASRFLHAILLMVSLSAHAGQTDSAGSNTLCDSFTDDRLNPELVAHLRYAARKGQLYRIDPDISSISFAIDSPIGRIQAEFRQFEGGFTLEHGATGIEGKAMLSALTDSVDTASGLVRSLLKSETFLDTDRYPELLFVSQDFFWVSNREAILIGDLTLHGVTRRIGLHVQLSTDTNINAGMNTPVRVRASARIQRAAFGITGLASYVSNDVTLYMDISAQRYRPAMDLAELK